MLNPFAPIIFPEKPQKIYEFYLKTRNVKLKMTSNRGRNKITSFLIFLQFNHQEKNIFQRNPQGHQNHNCRLITRYYTKFDEKRVNLNVARKAMIKLLAQNYVT